MSIYDAPNDVTVGDYVGVGMDGDWTRRKDDVEPTVYSCRAECIGDVLDFRNKIEISTESILRPQTIDTYYEFSSWMSLEELRNVLRKQVDSHVMLQTLRACTLKSNSLGRDWNIR